MPAEHSNYAKTPGKLLTPLSDGPSKRLCSRPAWRKRFRVQHKTLPIPRHKSKHPAPACQPASQTDVIDAHNMAIIAHLWKMLGKIQTEPHYLLPGVTPLECLPSYGVFSPLIRAKPIPQLISLSHFASYPAFSFPSSCCSPLHFLQAFTSSLSFLQIRSFNLIRFNRAHLHPLARLRHTFFVRPTNFASNHLNHSVLRIYLLLYSHINSINSAFFDSN